MLRFLRSIALGAVLLLPLSVVAQGTPASPVPLPASTEAAPAEPAPPSLSSPVVAPAPAAGTAGDLQIDRPQLDDLKPERPELMQQADESLLGSLVRLVLVLGLVLALVYLTLNWGLRKLLRLGPAQQAVVRVHERVALDAKRTVFLVEAGEEFLLLGGGEREVGFLAKLDPEKARAALEKKSARPVLPDLAGKPFWERLLVKPTARGTQAAAEAKKDAPSGGSGGTQAS